MCVYSVKTKTKKYDNQQLPHHTAMCFRKMQAAALSKMFRNMYLESTRKRDVDEDEEADDEVKEDTDNVSEDTWWFSSFINV